MKYGLLIGVFWCTALSSMPVSGQTVPGLRHPPGGNVQSGGWVRLEARYVLDPIPRQIAGWPQLARLVTKNDTYIRSLIPVVSEYKYADRMVRVQGRPFGFPRGGERLPSTHYFEVRRVELMKGALPRNVNFGGMPSVQVVNGYGAAQQHDGRWASLHGILDHVELGVDGATSTGFLMLEDGHRMELVNIVSRDPRNLWLSLLGERVTVVGLMGRRSHQGAPVFVERADAVCEGYVPRCGLQPGQKQGALRRLRPARGGQNGREGKVELPDFLRSDPKRRRLRRPVVPRLPGR